MKHIIGMVLTLWIVVISPVAIAVKSADVVATANEILACTRNRFSELDDDPKLSRRTWSKFTELFFASRVAEYTVSCADSCFDWQAVCNLVFDDYLKASAAAQAVQDKRAEDKLAPGGMLEMEFERSFVEMTNNQWFTHSVGHADITFDGLAETNALRIPKISSAAMLLARASQAPDLYAWYADTYHAQTPDYADGKKISRANAMADGIKNFRKLLKENIDRAVGFAKNSAPASSLFATGLAAHMVQDLVYHRGITLAQHSGLSYRLRKNPDYPEGWLEAEAETKAKEMTARLFRTVAARLDSGERAALAGWRPGEAFATGDLAQQFFPDGQDNSVVALIEYASLSSRFAARESELVMPKDCAKGPGLACWNILRVVEGILDE